MTRRTRRARTDAGPGREVAVLADGPWAPRRYWRADLEAMQHASRAMGYPDQHPSAILRGYRPTDEHASDDGPDGAPARLWRYQPPASANPSEGVPRQRRRVDSPDAARCRADRDHELRSADTGDEITHDSPAEHVRNLW